MDEASVRLDKWLWFARVTKTRSAAQKLVRAGGVRINRVKTVSPSKPVRIGDVLTISVGGRVLIRKVLATGTRRQSYALAQLLYDDLSAAANAATPTGAATAVSRRVGRPSKRERRATLALRNKEPR